MGRHKIEKMLFIVDKVNESKGIVNNYNESLNQVDQFEFYYELWNIDTIYDIVVNNDLFGNKKIQFILRIDENTFLYRSCNSKGQVYTIEKHDHEIDCNCTYATMFLKTGLKDEPCHHIREVRKFLGL